MNLPGPPELASEPAPPSGPEAGADARIVERAPMDTVLELLEKTAGIILHIRKLQQLPKGLEVIRDHLNALREIMGEPEMKANLTDFSPEDELTYIATGVRGLMGRAGLAYDGSAGDWRTELQELGKAADDLVSRARTRLDEVGGRDLTDAARRNMAELQRRTRLVEEAVKFLIEPGPYLETIKNLRDDILQLPGGA